MIKFINFVGAIFLSLFTLIIFVFIALVFYDDLNNIWGNIIAVIVLCLGFISTYRTYSFTISRGLLETLTANAATPEIDQFNNSSMLFHLGYLRIWGDWKARGLETKSTISTIEFNQETQCLFIQFQNRNSVSIWNPSIIHEASTYLKIIKASKITWSWENESYHFTYQFVNNKILTQTNSNWKTKTYDIVPSDAALVLLS